MVAELDMLASGFLAALRRASRNLAPPPSPPTDPAAASAADAVASAADAAIPAGDSSPTDSLPGSVSAATGHTTANADALSRTDVQADGLGRAGAEGSDSAKAALQAPRDQVDEAASAAQPSALGQTSRMAETRDAEAVAEGASGPSSSESVAEEISHPKVEPGMDRSDLMDAQTFGRRLIDGLKADGQTAVGWILQTFPKLLPFVMLSALRMDDEDIEDGEEE